VEGLSIKRSVAGLGFLAFVTGAAGCGSSSNPSNPTPVGSSSNTLAILCPAAPTPTTATGQSVSIQFGAPSTTGGAPPVTASCTPASGGLFSVGTTRVTCQAVDAQQRTSTCGFDVVVQAAPRISMTRFIAFGDSITWGEDGRNSSISPQGVETIRPAVRFPTPQTYPGALEAKLQTRYFGQSISVTNAGKSAESAGDSATVSRFSAVTVSSEVVLLMEGTNDLADRDSFDIPPAIANLRSMIRIAKSAGRRVFLATVPPMVPGRPRALAWSLVPVLNDQIRSLAASENVTLVDVYGALAVGADQSIGFDGEHPSADGYAKIADTFFAAIKSALEAPATTSTSRTFVLPLPHR